jgi:uncharacterized protein (TIGR00255 family)
MKSMTGYGRGECACNGFKVMVELSSVNRRQSELLVYLPRELEPLEARVRDEVNRHVARGRLTARITWHVAESGMVGRVHLNTGLAKAYARELERLAKRLKLDGDVTMDMLLRIPGVVKSEEIISDADEYWRSTEKALRQAIQAMNKMREREGEHLSKDLIARMTLIGKSIARICAHAPRVVRRFRENLRTRIREAGMGQVPIEDPRLLQEIAYFADRSDISEELTRLESHMQQFKDCLRAKEPVGRTLDFLTQEMNREVNTVGSKANDALISREVVTLKAELERFREQVQNIE